MAHLIDRLPGYIELGNLNELGVCDVEFDVSAWLADYPLGVLNITYTRPGEDVVYPVDMTGVSVSAPLSGNLSLAVADEMYTLTWTISNAVTAIAGAGSMVVQLAVADTVVKRSRLVQTIVQEGHSSAGDPPDPVQDWVADATSKLAETIAATEAANEAAGLTTDAIARANEISETMEGIAPLWADVDISVSALGEGAAPTASITQDETGTSISLGIPKGDTGAKGEKGNDGKPFTYRGDYNPDADPLYSKNDVVRFGGGSFVYINDVDSNEPTSSASHWQQIAAKGDTGPSAYDAAVAGGYTGTEAEFNAANAGIEAAKDAALDAADTANGAAQSADNARTSLTTEVGEALESIPAEVTAQINTRLGGLSLSVDPTDKGLNITYTY